MENHQILDLSDKSDVINDLKKIREEIVDEVSKENKNKDKVTKLMFEQMLKGLYLQIPSQEEIMRLY